ncbi:MAG: RNase H-like domain-containing protein [Candidatus Thiodiazotropha sp.]
MDWEAKDLHTAFKRFKEHARFMFEGPLSNKTEAIQCNYLMLWVGDKGRRIYSTWTIEDGDEKKLKTYYDKFEEYCKPKSNTIYNRYVFKSRVQKENESFEQFVTELKTLIKDCDYSAATTDEHIRDHIVFGVRSSAIRKKLILEGSDLTLTKCMDIAHTYELSLPQAQAIGNQATNGAVDAISHNRGRGRGRAWGKRRGITRQSRDQTNQGGTRQSRDQTSRAQKCDYCGNNKHKSKTDCPAYGKQCHKCSKYNHFAKICKSTKSVHEISCEKCDQLDYESDVYDDDTLDNFFVHTVGQTSSQLDQVFIKVSLGTQNCSRRVDCKIDTGSQTNCLPYSIFQSLKLNMPLEPSNATLTAYSGDRLSVRGKVTLNCMYKDKAVKTEFYVVESSAAPLLSLRTSLDLGLIQLTHSVDHSVDGLDHASTGTDKKAVFAANKDLFEGIGLLPGTCSLHLKDDAVPVVCPVRKVPFGLQDKLKAELDSMEAKQVICRVTEPSSWVHSLVCVEKPNGKLRVCLDPKALNDNIQRPYYPMRSIDDITSQLSGAKYFSVLDATKGYWAIRLDKPSSMLTTFNTPFGRYRYLRLPMGIRSSQDIFQRKVDEIFEGLQGVTSICDDILVFGRSRAEHDLNLEKVLQKSRENGLRFNPEKCQIGLTEVKYFGHVISSSGLLPDPEKVSAILNMPNPTNRSELETLLGMITYLTKFQKNLSDITSPMRELLRNDVDWCWGSRQSEAFQQVKMALTQTPVLSYYDRDKPVRLQVDASSKGLGVCCMQDGKPIAYASKTLTQTEVKYSQIEKEMLAILFGCTRFKHYIYGRRTVVESDCKPIESIMKKPLCSASPRLQRLMLQLQQFDIHVIHCPGTKIPLGDALSRNYVSETFPNLIQGLDTHVHTVIRSLPVSDIKIQRIQDVTRDDKQMQMLIGVIKSGWPETRQSCPNNVLEYWNHRDEISCENDIVFKGQKLVIPAAMRDEMIKAVHVGHFGIDKSVGRARDIMFWPGMSKQITDYVQSCAICNKYKDSNQKEPLHPHDVPQRPWQNLSLDLFTWNNQEYMVLVDAYSRWFEIDLLPNTKSISIIRKLKVHFSRFGICEKLKTDGAAYFTSEQFQQYCKDWGITHEVSSPTHASSNGLAEVYVKIAKRILQKAKDDNRDPYLPLLQYRNSPLKSCDDMTPAQLMFSRRLRSLLPSTNEQLAPKAISPKVARKKMIESQTKAKEHYDKTARKLTPLKIGESVHVQRDKHWEPANVISQHNEHSYNVQTPQGAVYLRNRKFLNKTPARTFPLPEQPAQPVGKYQTRSQVSFSDAASANINSPKEPQNVAIKAPATVPNSCTQEQPPPTCIKTRSGREVRPNQKYIGNDWVK